jgi:hypothetical protein
MNQDQLQQRYDQLYEKVRRMREYQKKYFQFRTQADLNASKNCEREVDHLLASETKRRASGQSEMF